MDLLHFDEKTASHITMVLPANPITARIHFGSIFVDSHDILTLQKQVLAYEQVFNNKNSCRVILANV